MKRPGVKAWRFKRRGPRLSTPGGTAVSFPHAIEQLLDYGSVAVVLLDAPSSFPRTVYGVDRGGTILWRLRQSPLHGKGPGLEDPYARIERSARTVRVFSRRGLVYDVHPRTGKIAAASPWRFTRTGMRLHTPSGKTVVFPHPVGQVIACGRVAVVLLNAPDDFPRNAYGVGRDGKILWRLQQTPFADAGKRDSFDSIGRPKQGRLVWAHSWWGTLYDVEPATGRIVRSYWTK